MFGFALLLFPDFRKALSGVTGAPGAFALLRCTNCRPLPLRALAFPFPKTSVLSLISSSPLRIISSSASNCGGAGAIPRAAPFPRASIEVAELEGCSGGTSEGSAGDALGKFGSTVLELLLALLLALLPALLPPGDVEGLWLDSAWSC